MVRYTTLYFNKMGTAPLESLQELAAMKQLTLIPQSRYPQEHGGSLLAGKRKTRRPLSIQKPLHLTLHSDLAYGVRSLLRHRPLIHKIVAKASKRFHVRVYEIAIVSNHIHLLVKGKNRLGLQNFFRVVAGHIAQKILHEFPITQEERSKRGGAPHFQKHITTGDTGGMLPRKLNHKKRSNTGGAPPSDAKRKSAAPSDSQNKGSASCDGATSRRECKFWQFRLYSKVIAWGRQYINVKKYLLQNTLEALRLIAYKPRRQRKKMIIDSS